jgi:hypothetical protein
LFEPTFCKGEAERPSLSYDDSILKCVRIFSKTFTILEIADSQGGAFATTPTVASALKAKSKFAESRRKKNEEKRKN